MAVELEEGLELNWASVTQQKKKKKRKKKRDISPKYIRNQPKAKTEHPWKERIQGPFPPVSPPTPLRAELSAYP